MGGIFGIVSREDCVDDLFYGTDYQSHLGTKNGGLAVLNGKGIQREIKDISRHSFRPQLEGFRESVKGKSGIGVISDYEPQPLAYSSRFGKHALVHVGKIANVRSLVNEARREGISFLETNEGKVNSVGVIEWLVNSGENIVDGIEIAQRRIYGSSSLAVLTKDGIYAARDFFGRTPLVIGKKEEAYAVASESCAFPTRGFEIDKFLGAGEIGILTKSGYEQLKKPQEGMQICTFLWVYYGNPGSHYEGINVEVARNGCGAALARRDKKEWKNFDLVAGIPDSGTPHAIGYAAESGVPFLRPFVKYVETWHRSFMPQKQETRDLVARMKLIPIPELVRGRSLLFCEDSIVRGTQLRDTFQRLVGYGAREIHMRPACPPLVFGCEFLNFSRNRNELDLAARRAVKEIEGEHVGDVRRLNEYTQQDSGKFKRMVGIVKRSLKLDSLKYQELGDLVSAIGLPKSKLCTYCWDGCLGCSGK